MLTRHDSTKSTYSINNIYVQHTNIYVQHCGPARVGRGRDSSDEIARSCRHCLALYMYVIGMYLDVSFRCLFSMSLFRTTIQHMTTMPRGRLLPEFSRFSFFHSHLCHTSTLVTLFANTATSSINTTTIF